MAFATKRKTGLVLSGGGACGDFEVGALHYLFEVGRINPSVICGTSVGSIHAAKLAEGAGASAGVPFLEDFWLNLMTDSDMFDVEDLIKQIFPQGFRIELLAQLGLVGLGPLGLLVMGLLAGGDLQTIINNLEQVKSLYDFAPSLVTAITQNVSQTTIAASGISLRMGTVKLEDGNLYYVDENRMVFPLDFNDDGTVKGEDRSGQQNIDDLHAAILASSAIPMVFPPQKMSPAAGTFVDGGVRATAPLDAAIATGKCKQIYVIVASPPSVVAYEALIESLTTVPANGDFSDATIVDIATRAAAQIMPTAIREYSAGVGPMGPPRVPTFVIQPSSGVSIHDTMTIDPGLISISMAYGYMRAGEVVHVQNDAERAALSQISDQIAITRAGLIDWENRANGNAMGIGEDGQILPSDASVIPEIRSLKQKIRSLVCQYTNLPGFSNTLFPTKDFRTQPELNAIATQPAPGNLTDYHAWWLQWERHTYSLNPGPDSPTPWDEFDDGNQIEPAVDIGPLVDPCA
jgi:NTE family protein